MTQLKDVIAANQLLVSLGAEDQMPKLAAISIETVLSLQSRISRALDYANQAPPNSAHAKNIARILDGSITAEDELHEAEQFGTLPPSSRRLAVTESRPPARAKPGKKTKTPRGKLKPGAGLTGRSTKERLELRAWIAEHGFDVAPAGRIPQKYIDAYDEYVEKMSQRRHGIEPAPADPGQLPL